MAYIGKSLVFFGLGIFILGVIIIFFSSFKIPFLGRLPGVKDIEQEPDPEEERKLEENQDAAADEGLLGRAEHRER